MVYRLVLALKRTHKNAIATGFRLYSFFIPRKEIEHRFDTRISTLSHPIRQMSMGASHGPAPARQGPLRRRSRGDAAHMKKGESHVVDHRRVVARALYLSVSRLDQARAVLIGAIQQEFENIGECHERFSFHLVRARVLCLDGRFHHQP
ncbi:hypothetical protein [Burkholderia lata]|uniref:hypothetical protein n=1 Tax=Burkholderia lata (strain ATCC 17760 / DSM 23089 / LMG 22485 / NCIMB 9086 / R18194 / 383) TaxID=482957 RepID=UPI0020C706B2|nr:hypothetical protein [Burkholderia lata]